MLFLLARWVIFSLYYEVIVHRFFGFGIQLFETTAHLHGVCDFVGDPPTRNAYLIDACHRECGRPLLKNLGISALSVSAFYVEVGLGFPTWRLIAVLGLEEVSVCKIMLPKARLLAEAEPDDVKKKCATSCAWSRCWL